MEEKDKIEGELSAEAADISPESADGARDIPASDAEGDEDLAEGGEMKRSRFAKAKKLTGVVLAMVPAAACALAVIMSLIKTEWSSKYWIHLGIMIVLMTGSLLLGYFRPRIHGAVSWVVWALAPAGAMLMAEWILRNPFNGKMSVKVIFLNIAVYYILSLLTLFITRRTWLSTVITTAVPILYSIANYYVMDFRGNALFPWDFASISTAMSVANNYVFDFGFVMALVVVTFIVVYQLAYFSRVKIMKSKVKMCVSFVLALIPLWMLSSYASYMRTDKAISDFRLYPYMFTPNSVYRNNGIAASFFFSLKFIDVEKPDGYSADRVEEILAEYEDDTSAEETKKPNIIAIMNEAYSDPSVLGEYVVYGEPFPFTSTLTENTVKGHLYVSVTGGNTANTEYEFLCGASMAFLPPGSVTYQQFLKQETPNLVSHLKSLGYTATAMHPYEASGWDRNKVYPILGFDDMIFLDEFKGYERLRRYISDRGTYDKIIELYESRTDDSPWFVFDVTMQNHGGYADDVIPNTVTVHGINYSSTLNQYLTLMRESEFAFQELIEYFSNVDEPTVILMFGDHQPGDSVVRPIFKQNGTPFPADTLEDQQDRNIVPFFIWANYDIEERDDVVLSANYLSTLLLETAGVELSTHQKYLADLYVEYPVINAYCYVDADGVFYPISDMANAEGVVEYQMVHYNQLIDYKNRAAGLEE